MTRVVNLTTAGRLAGFVIMAAALFIFSGASAVAKEDDDEKEEQVTLEQLPPAVKATLEKELNGAKPSEIEKETEKGKVIYEAEVTVGGVTLELTVGEDGKFLGSEVEKSGKKDDDDDDDDDDEEDDEDENEEKVTIDQVPAGVRATIEKEFKGVAPTEIEKETKDGKTTYEASLEAKGEELELQIAEDGTLIKSEVEKDDEDDDD